MTAHRHPRDARASLEPHPGPSPVPAPTPAPTAYLRDLLQREAATPDLAEVFARVDARSESSDVSTVDLIRADRDGR